MHLFIHTDAYMRTYIGVRAYVGVPTYAYMRAYAFMHNSAIVGSGFRGGSVQIPTQTETEIYFATLPDELCSETTHAFNLGEDYMKQFVNAKTLTKTFSTRYKYLCHTSIHSGVRIF
jgi:hypothetical protein